MRLLNNLLSISLTLVYSTTLLAQPDTWTQKANFGGAARHLAVGFSIGTKGYIGTGLVNSPVSYMNDFWEYDPATDAWTQRADFGGVARCVAVGFSIGPKGYIGTGSDNSALNDFWEYDPTPNTWTQKANFGGTARDEAVGFSIGTKGYIGTGSNQTDFWEYDPATDTWTQKANFGGGPRYAATGFSIGAKGYIGTGLQGNPNPTFKKDIWEYDPVADTWTQKADFGGSARYYAVGLSISNKGYIGGGANNETDFWEYDPAVNIWTQRANDPSSYHAVGFNIGTKGYVGVGFGVNFWEYGTAASPCTGNEVTLALNTDANASETTWEILNSGTNTAVCNGGGYANNNTISVACCLPNGCYDLRVSDSFGDGINPGGYVLRDANNSRIIDNSNNGPNFSTLSEVRDVTNTPVSFCVPIGNDALVPASCDQTGLTINSVIQAQINTNVSAQYGIASSTSGYQFWIFSPNANYSRRLFRSHAAPGNGWPLATPVAQRAAYLKLSAMSNAPTIPSNVLLNVRVRSRVAGVYGQFGPACTLTIGTAFTCAITQLTTTVTPVISCGATGLDRQNGVLWSNNVMNANKYQFEFVRATGSVFLRNISSNTRNLDMSTWGSMVARPNCSTPYNIRVRASFNNGTTWCPWGPVCTVSFTCPPQEGRELEDRTPEESTVLLLWPNPSPGDQVSLAMTGLDLSLFHIDVVVFDAFGKQVMTKTCVAEAGEVNASITSVHALAKGFYVVKVTAGKHQFIDRLVIE